ncbi:LysR family transcriptional regulator [Nocardia spumae]|uniref:LysR family transcriptional regulator n=1 Tax=Nocardia spumae TaxID=2887190 RepID=UPI001D142B90|nr:LysR family transcriptional regulator [Nocardia spumae]
MDLVAACRAFVAVSGLGSFTAGAAAARIPQSVASRRIAALESHLGARLLDRSARTATLTPFGRDMLPSARRLVESAETMERHADQVREQPFRLAVPEICGPVALARLVAACRGLAVNLDPHPEAPARRGELARTQEVRAAIVAVAADQGVWRVPLGLAGADLPDGPVYLESLRVVRVSDRRQRRRIWIQPEDDLPHIRDRMIRSRDALGLRPGQMAVAPSLVAAVAAVLDAGDLLLCSRAQARELELRWRPIGELEPVRGYDVAAGVRADADRIRALPPDLLARCLGAPAERE